VSAAGASREPIGYGPSSIGGTCLAPTHKNHLPAPAVKPWLVPAGESRAWELRARFDHQSQATEAWRAFRGRQWLLHRPSNRLALGHSRLQTASACP